MLPDSLRFARLADVGILTVSGPDRRAWLQGMITMDVLEPFGEAPRYAALLDGKGRILADLTVVDDVPRDRFWLLVESGRAATALTALSRLLVAEDVELADVSAAMALVTVQGLEATALARTVAVAGGPEAVVLEQTRSPAGGADLVLPTSIQEGLIEALVHAGAATAEADELEQWRIAAGIPKWGRDFDDQTLPQEAGLLDALHWGKGCYVGQEVVARLGHRGQTTRELRCIVLEGSAPVGSSVFLPGEPDRAVGTLTSVAAGPEGSVGIALLRRRAFDANTALLVVTEAGSVPATVSSERVRAVIPLRPENDPTFRAQRPQRGLVGR